MIPNYNSGSDHFHQLRSAAQRGAISSGCLIAAVVTLLVVGAASYGVYRYGLGAIEDEVQQDLMRFPVVQEQLGEIQDLSINYEETGTLEGEEDFAFRVRGTLGSGVVRVTLMTGVDNLEHVTKGTLTLDDGTTFDLIPEADPGTPTED